MENTTDFLEVYGILNRTRGTSPGYLPINVELSSEIYPLSEELSSEIYPLPAKIVICVLLSLMIVTTIAGNVFVIAAILLERSLRGVSNYLIMSLAVTDLMVAILVMPISVVDEVSADWNLGSTICDMWISFDVLCCTASILHLVAIAFDRYWAVSNIDYIRRRCAKQMGIMVLTVWLVAVTISIPPLFGWKDDSDPDITKQCMISQNLGYTIFSTLGAFYCPLILMLVLNIKIYVAARTRIRKKGFYGYQRPAPVSAITVTATEGHNISPNSSGSDVSQDRFSAYNGSCMNMNELSRIHSAGELTEEHPTLACASTAARETTAGSTCAETAGGGGGVVDKGGGGTTTGDPKYSRLTNISCCVPRSSSETFKTTATITITTTAAAATTSSSNRAKICDAATNQLLVPSHGGGGGSGSGGKPKGQSRPAANGNIKRVRQRERERAKKEKIELKRERKAARVIAIITGGFVACWLPFFLVALIGPICGHYCFFPRAMMRVFLWLGYLNSLLNPIIYTIFNPSFRTAFRKLIYGKYRIRSQCR